MAVRIASSNDDGSDRPDQGRRRLLFGGCTAAAGALLSGFDATDALAQIAPDVSDWNPPADRFLKSVTLKVNAPASLVWDVLVDLPNYHLWNVSVPRMESTMKIGDPIRMWWAPAGVGEPMEIVQYLAVFEPPRHMALVSKPSKESPWSARTARGDRYIVPLGPEQCNYYDTDSFLGRTPPDEETRKIIQIGFDARVLGIKWRAEQLYKKKT